MANKTETPEDVKESQLALENILKVLEPLKQPERARILKTACIFYEVPAPRSRARDSDCG